MCVCVCDQLRFDKCHELKACAGHGGLARHETSDGVGCCLSTKCRERELRIGKNYLLIKIWPGFIIKIAKQFGGGD